MNNNVINYIKEARSIVSVDELEEKFHDISQKELLNTILSSPDIIFRTKYGERIAYHISTVDISDENMEAVKKIIDEKIDENEFITYRQLAKEIEERFPAILCKNFLIYPEYLIDFFERYFNKKYYFNWNIISLHENKISPGNVYAKYADGCCKINLTDAHGYGRKIGVPVDYDELYKRFVPIDKENLVPIENVRFDIAKTDEEIDRSCRGDYISSNAITDFSGFPDTGFPWNRYLLGYFVYKYSRKYMILTNNRIDKSSIVCGNLPIVKRGSEINTVEKLLATVLAKSNVDLDNTEYPDDPWSYLWKNGYMSIAYTRTRMEAKVLAEAKALRRIEKQ